MIETTCKNCNKTFLARKTDLKRGQAKFCSRECYHSYPRKRSVKEPNSVCAYCNKEFYKRPSSKKNSKSGLFFCCRGHKDLSQRIGGLSDIMPPHYRNGISVYREIAFKELPHRCNDCGWSEVPEVLHAHHIDRDRTNNRISNLVLLCGRCQDIRHYKTKTGIFS